MNQTLLYRSLRNALLVHFPKRSLPSRHCEDVMCAEPPEEVAPPQPLLFDTIPSPMTPRPLFVFSSFDFAISGGTPPYTLSYAVPPEANIDVSVYNDPPSGNVRMQNNENVIIAFTVTDAAGQASTIQTTFEAAA